MHCNQECPICSGSGDHEYCHAPEVYGEGPEEIDQIWGWYRDLREGQYSRWNLPVDIEEDLYQGRPCVLNITKYLQEL
jgi:hypothetical protein